jgi:hypothetical protein
MSKMTTLEKPLTRRIGGSKLVVRISKEGVEFRGYRCRTWHPILWARVASLLDRSQPLIMEMETQIGHAKLREIGAE